MKKIIFIILFGFLFSETNNKVTIAFGSCNHQDKKQILWNDIINENPDLWIWLGDNIYADTNDMELMKKYYLLQKSNYDYKRLLEITEVTGTWDDHDYGKEDAGKNYLKKKESQQLLLDFLDVKDNDPRRKREGVYHTYVLDKNGISIKIFVLDTRYFRDDIKKNIFFRYKENQHGSILGDDQWEWFENELKHSKSDVNIIVSSIQLIPIQHKSEKWANFPNEREKIFNILKKYNIKNPIIISGDRHIGEISKITYNEMNLYEVTSSSLTNPWKFKRNDANRFRVNSIVYELNYGTIDIIEINDELVIELNIKSNNGIKRSSIQLNN